MGRKELKCVNVVSENLEEADSSQVAVGFEKFKFQIIQIRNLTPIIHINHKVKMTSGRNLGKFIMEKMCVHNMFVHFTFVKSQERVEYLGYDSRIPMIEIA